MNIPSSDIKDLLAITQDLKAEGYRLGQICATLNRQINKQKDFDFRLGQILKAGNSAIEILYTFVKDNRVKNYKFILSAVSPRVQSITAIYPYAFVYENEIHDLFGITFKNLTPDYGGNFYKLAKKTPWNPPAHEEKKNG